MLKFNFQNPFHLLNVKYIAVYNNSPKPMHCFMLPRQWIVIICFFIGMPYCVSQNKNYTDSLINELEKLSAKDDKGQQILYETIISELVEYDSLKAERYLEGWKKYFYNTGTNKKIFYHKNRGILLMNFSNFNGALAEIFKGISFATKENKQLEMADLYNNRANVYSELEKDENAISDYDSAALIYRQLGMKADEALVLSNKANLYGAKANFKEAIPMALESLKIREELKNEPGMANTSFNLAIFFKNLGRYDEALNYLAFPEIYYRKTNNEKSLARVYLVKGSAYRSKKMYKESKEFFLKAIPTLEKYEFKGGLVNAYENLGTLAAVADSNETEALKYYLKAESIVSELNNVQGTISTGINVAQSMLLLQQFEQFEVKIKAIEKLARENHYNQELQEILKLRMNYAFKKNGVIDGSKFFEEFEKLRDAASSKDIQQQISDLKIKYETEKKEAQIKLLNSANALQRQTLEKNKLLLLNNALALERKDLQIGNQELLISNQELNLRNKDFVLANNGLELKNKEQKINILNLSDKNKALKIHEKNRQLIFGFIAFMLLIGMGMLFYNRTKLKQKSQLQAAIIKEQDSAARAVIGAEENERSRMSQTLHDGLGQLLSAAKMNLQAAVEHLPPDEKSGKIYANALQLVDESIVEMRSVSHQMVTSNVIRKGLANALKELVEKIENNRLKISVDVNGFFENINPEIQIMIYRILQESIHNVVKHAAASKIDIHLSAESNQIITSVRDNGIGFVLTSTKNRKGIGLDNIETRVKFLKGDLKISSAPGHGTTLDIRIPLTL